MKRPETPPNESERLRALKRYDILDTSAEPAYDDITRLASHIMGVPIALVSLVDETRQWFKSHHGLDATETPREVAFCAHVVADGGVLVVPDAHLDERFADNPLVTDAPHVRFYAGAPLETDDGFRLGTLCAIDHQPQEPTPMQLEMLRALARQVMTQMDLRLQLRRVRAQRTESESFFELSLDMHCVAGFDGYFKQLNPSWERVLGWTRAELCSKPFVEFVHPDDRAATIAEAAKLADGGTTITFDNRYECRDGSFRTLSWKAASDVERDRIYAVARDVTAERAVETMKNEFVSVVSHELRTPLTSIRGALRMVDEGVAGELPSKAASLIRIAASNTERLVRLVNDILDLEKIQSGKLELEVREHELRPFLEELIESLAGMAEPAGVSLRLDHLGPESVHADRDSLAIVLTNLVSNAIKHSAPGDEVVVRARDVDSAVVFEVVDEGPGIAQADQHKLFRRFQQLDSSDSRRRSGSGLGLAISKAIVQEHGGEIGVRSDLGAGATFHFRLPAGGPLPVHAPPSATSSVLLVEDDRDVAQVLASTLSNGDTRVVHADSLDAARDALAEEVFDLVLLDIGLPDGSGLDLVREMRAEPRLEDVPVVVLSGEEPEHHPTVLEWLQKPIDGDALTRRLHRLTRRPGPPRALVIEDDEDARAVLLELLRTAGVEAVGVATGADAIRVGRADPPDLVVLDVGLPDVDGFEVVRGLARGQTRVVPMIVYTGRDLSAEERARLRLGRTRHLTKSRVTNQEFVATVKQFLRELLIDSRPPRG